MNRLLADALSAINALLALLIILISIATGAFWGGTEPTLAGAIVGLIVGGLLAVLVCGFLALLVDIRDLLQGIWRKG